MHIFSIRVSIIFLFLAMGQIVEAAEIKITPKEALEKLVKGNQRFMEDELTCPDRISDRRIALAAKQKPYAVILGCSDSRIPPEIVFDQGIGDLFVVRVAGNVFADVEMDSIKYSVLHNGSCLVIVLGHENCGAVSAVLDHQAQDVPAVAGLIEASLRGHESDSLQEAVVRNVKYQVDLLRKSKEFAGLIKEGKLEIVGAYYHFITGKVDILKSE